MLHGVLTICERTSSDERTAATCCHTASFRSLASIPRGTAMGAHKLEKILPSSALRDKDFVKDLLESAHAAVKQLDQPIQRVRWFMESTADPNDWRLGKEHAIGISYPPPHDSRPSTNGNSRACAGCATPIA